MHVTSFLVIITLQHPVGLPRRLSAYRIHLQRRRHRKRRFDPWVGKIPWRRHGNALQ